jgi:hypothetical protein
MAVQAPRDTAYALLVTVMYVTLRERNAVVTSVSRDVLARAPPRPLADLDAPAPRGRFVPRPAPADGADEDVGGT